MRRSLVVVFCLVASRGRSASIALPDAVAAPGQVFVPAISLATEGQSVSGVQFDIDAGAGLSFGILPGAQIGASSKVLYAAPLPNNTLRVVIVGMNRQPIADGELLRPAAVVDPAAQPQSIPIRITNAVATDVDGNSIAIAPVTAIVQVQAGAPGQSFAPAIMVNAASLLSGPISPGEIVTVFGGAALASVSAVQVNGTPAPILYAGPGQVNAIVPFSLDPAKGDARIELLAGAASLGRVAAGAVPASPALFTASSTGMGPGAILNEDYSLNSFANPASAGSEIMLYGTGFGALNPPLSDGQAATDAVPILLPVTATVGGVPANVLYAGAAPGLVAGLVQINIQIPAGVAPSPAVPVSLTVGGVGVAPGVTVSIQ